MKFYINIDLSIQDGEVVVTHEMGFASQVGDRLIFMDEGRIVEEGKPSEMMKNPQSDRLKDFLGHVKHH